MSELIEAAKAGDLARVREILRGNPCGGGPRGVGETAIMDALFRGHRDLDSEVEIPSRRRTALDSRAAALGRDAPRSCARPRPARQRYATTAGPRSPRVLQAAPQKRLWAPAPASMRVANDPRHALHAAVAAGQEVSWLINVARE